MNATKATNWTAVCAAVLMATAVFRASADQSATASKPEKSYTGTVSSIDPAEHVLRVKGWLMLNKTFNFGENCALMQLDKNPATMNDLRPGEKVKVSYQDSHGVRITDRVEQQPMLSEGMVKAIDPVAHTLTLRSHGMDKILQIADDCAVKLRNDKSGALPDIQVGNHVTVTYEEPADKLQARQIAQTSIEFTGTLTAIDLGEKTLKARAMFNSKKFNVADNCAIVINGKTDGHLSDLKPDEKLVFSYDEINGVNVVNRIAPADARPNPVASTTTVPVSGY